MTKVLLLPLVPKGGGPRDPTVENLFPTGILQWNLHHICMGYKSPQIWKKNENVVPFENGGQITDFCFASFWFWQKFEKKKTLSQIIFYEMWLKVGEHEYNYITEITFENNYSVLKWRPKQFFWYCAIMLIYAN